MNQVSSTFPAVVFLVAVNACGTSASATDLGRVDLAIVNAKVWTGDIKRPDAQVVLIDGDRITAVGGEELLKDLPKDSVIIIDAGGRRVIPGLIDCHAHLIEGGLMLSKLQLRDATSKEDFLRRVKEYASTLAPGEWLIGRGWTTESWNSKERSRKEVAVPRQHSSTTEPTKEWIDSITRGRPAVLTRMDGHQALANSVALRLAGVTKQTPDPPGGRIMKDPITGEPTGILKDTAEELVTALIPSHTLKQRKNVLQRAKRMYNRLGVTMVHDMSEPDDGEVFLAALKEQTATRPSERLRIYSFYTASHWPVEPQFFGRPTFRPNVAGWFWFAGFKGYMDGSMGSRTAYMREPFLDNPPEERGWRGLLGAFAIQEPPNDVARQFHDAAAGGWQATVHAIGDQANHLALNAYEEVLTQYPDWRPRIEHVQHLLPSDVARFGKLGVIASMQPYHKADDGRYVVKRIGKERCKTSYAFRSLLDSGAVVCFGSDWPVVSNNPFLGIHAAVTGRTLDGTVFVPEQNISVVEALRCYTANAAHACYMEDRLGKIKPGFLADIVILNQDILNIPADEIAGTTVHMTMVGGHVVWSDGQE